MRILWIAFIWPEPDSSAAGFRTLKLLEVLQGVGHDVRICSPCSDNPYRDDLVSKGFETESIPPNDSRFDAFLSNFAPEVVVFDRFMIEEQFGWRVKNNAPEAVRILDTVDLQFLRKGRADLVAAHDCFVSDTPKFYRSETAFREIAAILQSDISLLVSNYERELLVRDYGVPASLLELCSFMYESSDAKYPTFEERKNFVAIGNFSHRPNLDAFYLLNSLVWPKLREVLRHSTHGDVELHIYGAYPSRDLMKLDDPSNGFRVVGKAEHAVDCLADYRVNLAPLRFGAGIKGKISDGWAAGTPCIATSIAAEGMTGEAGFGGEVVDTCDDFVLRASELYSDREKWSAARARGRAILMEKFDSMANSEAFLRLMTNAKTRAHENRANNFLGGMLSFHALRSTEFMSRWIEVKEELARTRPR